MSFYEDIIFPRLNEFVTHGLADFRSQLAQKCRGDVLEIGAGSGLMFDFYGDSVDKIDAIEPSQGMLDIAKKHGDSRIKLHQASAENLPFPDDSFDCVVVFLVLCTVTDIDQSLLEIKRVLRPGGIVHYFEHVAPKKNTLKRKFFEILNPFWQRPARGCQLIRETENHLKKAGFTLTETIFSRPPSRLLPIISGSAIINECD